MTYLHSSVQTPIRSALKQMLKEFKATHILTLAFHEPQINLDRAKAKISRWHHHAMHRLFGRRCFQLPADQTIEFWLLPEAGNANLHFHGLIRVPPTHLAYFERFALPRWKRVAYKGTIDFQPLRPTAEERDQWFNYITKSTLAVDILHSSMLFDPDFKPESRKTNCQIRNSKLIKPILTEVRREPEMTCANKNNGIH